MIIFAVYVLVVLMFCLSFYFTRIMYTFRQVMGIVHESTGIITDGNLDDLAKEEAIKKAALGMVKQCFVMIIKIAIVCAITVIPMWIADLLKLSTLSETVRFAARWDVLLVTTVVVLVPVILLRHKE